MTVFALSMHDTGKGVMCTRRCDVAAFRIYFFQEAGLPSFSQRVIQFYQIHN